MDGLPPSKNTLAFGIHANTKSNSHETKKRKGLSTELVTSDGEYQLLDH